MAGREHERAASVEEEPLLGGPGDAVQQQKPLYHNFVIGTGVVAQAGAWILAAIVWGAVLSNDLMLFSAHPVWHPLLSRNKQPLTTKPSQLLNSAALLFFIQGTLVLQPTATAKQKKQGTYVHAALNDVAFLAALAGLIIIEYNKFDHNGVHFESAHAILGLITYILVVIQLIVGITQYFTPRLYGSVDNAKSLYKYHRLSGYVILLLMLATVCAATQTTFNVKVLQIQLWAVVVASLIVVLGIGARIRLNKFGYLAGK